MSLTISVVSTIEVFETLEDILVLKFYNEGDIVGQMDKVLNSELPIKGNEYQLIYSKKNDSYFLEKINSNQTYMFKWKMDDFERSFLSKPEARKVWDELQEMGFKVVPLTMIT